MTKVQTWNTEIVDRLERHLQRHFDALEQIIKAVSEEEADEEYTRRKGAIALDATGAGTVVLPVPLGYDWTLQRVTITSTGNGQVTFYENTVSPLDTLEIIGSSQLYSDAFSNNIVIPSGSTLFIVFANAGANGTGSYNLQIKITKKKAHTHAPKVAYLGNA